MMLYVCFFFDSQDLLDLVIDADEEHKLGSIVIVGLEDTMDTVIKGHCILLQR